MTQIGLAKEYRTRYPATPSLTLARIMYKENISMFKNVEGARTALRAIEGKIGSAKRLRPSVKNSPFLMSDPRPYNPYKLPDSDEIKYEPYTIKGHKRVGILSDIHFPYHSIEALTAAIKDCKKEKVDAVLLNGDTVDFYQLSRFDKDPRKRNFAGEIEAVKEFFAILEKQLKCKIYFKTGNHEARYEAYMFAKAKELLGLDQFRLEEILDFKKYGIEMIDNKRIIHLNKLNVIHGHEFASGFFSPVNVARGLFLRGKVSAMQGHNHATSEHTEPNMNGEITTTWSVGCLCELHPHYMPINKWNHGLAHIDLDTNGRDFFVRNKRIYNGEIL